MTDARQGRQHALVIVCDAVVLAAGSSSRLGFPKQLLMIAGESLLLRIVRQAQASGCRRTVVVLGAFLERLRAELAGSVNEILENPLWKEGLGASVRLAAQHARQSLPSPPEALLFLTTDQPGVNAQCIQRLLTAADGDSTMVAAAYEGTVGIPALFKRVHFAELAELRGAQGARSLLLRYPEQVWAVSMPEAAADIDTATDWEEFQSSSK